MTSKCLQTLTGHTDRIWTVAWHPKGNLLASSGSDKSIRLWKQEGSKWICDAVLVESHRKTIRHISWSPCGNYLASASFDSTICLWKRNSTDASWSTVGNLEGHESEVKCVAWSHDGIFLASCGRDKSVWIWEKELDNDNEDSDVEYNNENWDCSDVKTEHTKDVKKLVWHPNENILVSCSYDETVRLYNKLANEWSCFQILSGHESTVWSAEFSSSGEFLATCSDDKTVKIWRNSAHNELPVIIKSNSWKCIATLQGYHSRVIYDLSWCKLTDTLVAASADNTLSFYTLCNHDSSPPTFKCTHKQHGAHNQDINTVAWNPVIKGIFASSGDDEVINIWSYEDIDLIEGKETPNFKVTSEILARLTDLGLTKEPQLKKTDFSIEITDHSHLLKTIQEIQEINLSISSNVLDFEAAKIFNLDVCPFHSDWIDITEVIVTDGKLKSFVLNLKDTYKFKLLLTYQLNFKQRSCSKTLVVTNRIFFIERNGNLWGDSLGNGQIVFLLGHLCKFEDLKFIIDIKNEQILYVLSVDRDEKIRISNFPNSYNIKSYCYGHKYNVKRLIVIDDNTFLSVDDHYIVSRWSLKDADSISDMIPRDMLELDKKFLLDNDIFSPLDGMDGEPIQKKLKFTPNLND